MNLKNPTKKFIDLNMDIDNLRIPNHVAVIMDGNGRWGVKKGLSRSDGHNMGVSVLKNILKFAKRLGVKVLTVYAFSTENWSRPLEEVNFLMNLFISYQPTLSGSGLVGSNRVYIGINKKKAK